MAGGLHAPSRVRELLQRHGLRPDKAFGQNFLVDAAALSAIVEAAALEPDDTVLEIGPGLGVLTAELVRRAGRVLSVELDARLLPVLQETVGRAPNLEIRQGDALELDLTELPPGSKLVANLPYNVATPLVARALESGRFARLAFMVQKEVADRLVADAGDPAYGAVSLLVRHYGKARVRRTVSPGCFYPPPEVTSAIVVIEAEEGVEPQPKLFRLVRQAFQHRRKTVKRNLIMAGYPAEVVEAAMRDAGLDARIRAEAIDLAGFVRLLERLQHNT